MYVIIGMVECLGSPVIVEFDFWDLCLIDNWVVGLGIARYIVCALFWSCFGRDTMLMKKKKRERDLHERSNEERT